MKKPKNLSRYLTTFFVLTTFGLTALGSGSSDSDTATKVGEVGDKSSSVIEEKKEELKGEIKNNLNKKEEKVNDEKSEMKSEYFVGDTIITDDLKIVYMESGTYISDNEFLVPKDGYKYVYIKLYAENISDSDQSISAYSFEGFADGYNVEQSYILEDMLSGELSSGKTTVGTVCFEVPIDTSSLEIEYDYDIWSSEKLKLIYEGDKKSDFVPEVNTEKSADAFEVGSIIETDKLRISYLSCEDYISDNMFITPKEGYKFISLMLEVENISDSDQSISCYDFECYADGTVCDATYARDDSLSAELSAGRKAKGSVSFEVPVDATTIEVECETNYWTQKKIIFSCK